MLGFLVGEALRDLRRAGRVAVSAILLITLSLAALGGFWLVSANLDRAVGRWRDRVRIIVYLRREPAEADLPALLERVHGVPGVASAVYVSRTDALHALKQVLGKDAGVVESLPTNPLPERFGLYPVALGSDVVFGAGQYAPHTGSGLRTLAHELAHVVQQRAAGPAVRGPPASPARGVVRRQGDHPFNVHAGPPSNVPSEKWREDVERAYRRLARRFHPDINPGDRAAAMRFRQIVQAYETLIDPDRRSRYDAGTAVDADDRRTSGFEGFDFSRVAEGAQASTFSEIFSEVFRQAHIATPVLVIGGRNDLPGFQEAHYSATLATWLENVRFHYVSDAGHYPMQETPILFASLIEGHFSSTR